MKYNIHEIFYSVQGEGFNTGSATIFIRTAGCSMRCKFCDTKDSWKTAKHMTVEEILEHFKKQGYPCRSVTITGGEPFEQEMTPLWKDLVRHGCRVHFETNGSQPIPAMVGFNSWVTISPKKVAVHPENFRFAREMKFVISSSKDLIKARKVMARCPGNCLFYLQPMSQSEEATAICIAEILKDPSLKLSIQTQKYINVK